MSENEFQRVNKTLAGIILFSAASLGLANHSIDPNIQNNHYARNIPAEAVMPEAMKIKKLVTFQRRGSQNSHDESGIAGSYDNLIIRYLRE